jgi:glycosyltransferase involved in cell wall biosynthesis
MKVAFVSVQSRSVHFRTYLDFLLSRGHEVVVLTNTSEIDSRARVVDLSGGLRGSDFMPRGVGLLVRVWRLWRALRAERPDVLDLMPVTPDGLYAACMWRGPLQLDFWGSDILHLASRPWWIRRLMSRVILKADRIHSVSSHMTDVLTTMGASEKVIETFQYGIDLRLFAFAPAPKTSRRILFTRGLKDFYRLEIVLRAMPDVVRRCPGAHLFVTRAGPPLDKLRALVRELGIEAAVTFLGLVPRTEVAEECRRAAVWVSIPPSDGAPLSLIEAMACGPVPVVSDLDTVREWLDETRAVFVRDVSPQGVAEHIVRGLEMAEDGSYAAANRLVVEQRGDCQVNLPRWEAMLRAAVSSHGSGRPTRGGRRGPSAAPPEEGW